MNILTDTLKVDMQNSPKNMPKFQDWLETRDLNEGLFANVGKWAGGLYGAKYGRQAGKMVGTAAGGLVGGVTGGLALPFVGSVGGTALGGTLGNLLGQGAGLAAGGYLGGKKGEKLGQAIDNKIGSLFKKTGDLANKVTGRTVFNDPSIKAARASTGNAEKQIKGLSKKDPKFKPVYQSQQQVSNQLTKTAASPASA